MHDRLARLVGPRLVPGLDSTSSAASTAPSRSSAAARRVQPPERHRLEVAAAPAGRDRGTVALGLGEPCPAALGIAAVEAGAGRDRRQLAVGAHAFRRHAASSASSGLPWPRTNSPNQLSATSSVASSQSSPATACWSASQLSPSRAQPACRAPVQLAHLGPRLARQADPQQLREQRVVAVPGAVRVEPDDEAVRALEGRERVRPAGLAGDRVREPAAQPVDHRGAQQERAQARAAAGRGPPPPGSRRRPGRRRRTRRRSSRDRRGRSG